MNKSVKPENACREPSLGWVKGGKHKVEEVKAVTVLAVDHEKYYPSKKLHYL